MNNRKKNKWSEENMRRRK